MAGVDMEMAPPFGSDAAFLGLAAELKAGRITMERLDEAVRRILEMKLCMGLFEAPYVDLERLV